MKRMLGRTRGPRRSHRSRGIALVEVTVGLSTLVAVSLLLLKASISATAAQRWTIIQGMTDSYMTRETAVAKRIPFSEIVVNNSDWPRYPAIASETVEIGRLPGGIPVTAVVQRTRVPSADNFPSAGGTGSTTSNPSRMEVWSLQSMLSYQLNSRDYVKSRTVVRSQ